MKIQLCCDGMKELLPKVAFVVLETSEYEKDNRNRYSIVGIIKDFPKIKCCPFCGEKIEIEYRGGRKNG